jgi:hypothetical protein
MVTKRAVMKDFTKDSYEVIEKKLALAELTIELGEVTREKWARLETMRDILSKEERLLKEIANASKELQGV